MSHDRRGRYEYGIVDNFVKGGSTVNICAIDLSKAFDKVNHHTLYCKLIKRLILEKLLGLLVNWLSCCFFSVQWFCYVSRRLLAFVRFSLFSPFLICCLFRRLARSCCTTNAIFIILYADDILLIAPSVCELEKLLRSYEKELYSVDTSINFKKYLYRLYSFQP